MAYNRENFLKRVAEIQDLVLEHKKEGATQLFIFETYIKRQYHISYSCFNDYLSIPAKAELKRLIEKKDAGDNQLNLFE